ncbi:VWA domain-containing protein [Deinococcus sp. QL22]|uniref:VWA domain-containing protein n=1 Tax=Deinococcus sp. QL22 TaxID=2939437 RepID=UPI002017FBDD|nr:VWA domain-containing protein [Deinococcus sp. QL22]UQN08584.1 VWA domain-containing protein [Deinococcus sp. QL22]
MTPDYPLAAVAHQPELLFALSLLAVAPSVGGLLIRGDRGAAKSTAARGLALLLPSGPDLPAPFVNLPLGATEDRVIGTLDLEAALRGEARLKSGLLAQADGGLLYIDEVNLLPDHLVDLLLDASAMGVVRVQRDTLSAEQPARFALVGSMNPEEGQLRPQFLDRFGLCVEVSAPHAPAERAEIIRRRMAFEADPTAFVQQWQEAQVALGQRLVSARHRFPNVSVPDALLETITTLSSEAGVRSLRADLVLHRAARACAALEQRSDVTAADLHRVAPFALLHRQSVGRPPSSPPTQGDPAQGNPVQGNSAKETSAQQPPASPPPGEPSPPDTIFAPTAISAPLALNQTPLRGSQQQAGSQHGGTRAVPNPQATQLHVPATLRSALGRGSVQLTAQDIHTSVPEDGGRRVLFVADTSGSVGTSGRMGAVKAALLDVLTGHTRRDRAALIVFRGTGATLLLDWTTDRAAAEDAIRTAPTGGRTPLAHALQLAADLLAGQRLAELVLFTDGRANVPLTPASDPWTDTLTAAAGLRGKAALVVDTEAGQVRLGRAAQLARILGATLQVLEPA